MLGLNLHLEFLASMKSYYATFADGYRFACARVAARTWGFGAHMKITKTCNSNVVSIEQALSQKIKKSFNHLL